MTRPAKTIDRAEIATFGPTLDGRTVAGLFGISYYLLLEMTKAGSFPVEPLRLGRKLRWPTAKLLDVLGIPPGEVRALADIRELAGDVA